MHGFVRGGVLAVGRLVVLALVIAAVLGGIALLATYLYRDSHHPAEMTLLDAKVAATVWSESGRGRPPGFIGFTPETATTIKALTWNTSTTAVSGEVSIRAVTDTSILLVTKGPSEPRCIALTMSSEGSPRATYGVIDAQTVAECADPSW